MKKIINSEYLSTLPSPPPEKKANYNIYTEIPCSAPYKKIIVL